jgi:signal transduction histidine kinase
MIALEREVDEHRHTVEQLRAAHDRAEAVNRAKNEFLSALSHDLRTPLNAVLGFAQLLETDAKDTLSDEQAGYLGRVLSSGRDLRDLIDEVLDLSRIGGGESPIEATAFLVQPLIDEVAAAGRALADAKAIKLVQRTDSVVGRELLADRSRTKQVLLNLVTNAIKCNDDGGSVRIEAALPTTAGEGLRIAVADAAPESPCDKQGPISQRTARSEREHLGGLGIGLFIARELVRMMNGRMGQDSDSGSGRTFWVELPMAPSDQAG